MTSLKKNKKKKKDFSDLPTLIFLDMSLETDIIFFLAKHTFCKLYLTGTVSLTKTVFFFAKVYFSYRTIGLVSFNKLSDPIKIDQTL